MTTKKEKNYGIFLMPGGEFERREILSVEPKKGYKILKPISIGCCGSDVGYSRESFMSADWPSEGIAMGHEVVAVSDEGKKYVVNPQKPCGHCELCLSGRENLCPNVTFMGVVRRGTRPQVEGALRGNFLWPEDLLYELPEGINPITGTMIEPLSCAVHSVITADVKPDQEIMVIGSGQMGILISLLLSRQAHPITLIGRNTSRNSIARDVLGEEVLVNNKYLPKTFDIVIDCAGSKDTLEQAISLVKPGGKIIAVGNYAEVIIPVNMYQLTRKSATLVSSRRFTGKDFRYAMRLLSDKVIMQQVEQLISPATYEITPQGVAQAFQRAREDKSQIKIVIGSR